MSDATEPVNAERRLRDIGISGASISTWKSMAAKEGDGRTFDELMAEIPGDWLKVLDEMRGLGGIPFKIVPWQVWAHAKGKPESAAG
jgi:hypothetical protein